MIGVRIPSVSGPDDGLALFFYHPPNVDGVEMTFTFNRLRSPLLAILLGVVAAAVIATPVQAQPMPQGFGFGYTYHLFANDDTTSLLELAYQFSNLGLTYRTDPDKAIRAKLYLRLSLQPTHNGQPSGAPFVVDWMNAVPEPPKDEPAHLIAGLRTFAIPQGSYNASIYIEDVNDPARHDTTNFPLMLPAFGGDKISLSDIEIASEAYAAEEPENLFYKNSHIVVPNIMGVLDPPLYELNSYVEIYNAETVTTPTFDIVYQIAGPDKKLIYERSYTLPHPEAGGIVRVESMPLDSLPSATYLLRILAFDGPRGKARDSAVRTRSFSLKNPAIDSMVRQMLAQHGGETTTTNSSDNVGLIDPMWGGSTEPELDVEFKRASWIATNSERNMWLNLSGADAKARFLTQFWGSRDEKPETPENEFQKHYYGMAEQARIKFRSPMAPNGWDSDRGRVLLSYGQPDEIDRHPQDYNKFPYEVWTYRTLGYEFVFVDKGQIGEYNIVHSNAPREVLHENWEKEYATVNQNW